MTDRSRFYVGQRVQMTDHLATAQMTYRTGRVLSVGRGELQVQRDHDPLPPHFWPEQLWQPVASDPREE